MCVSVCVCKQAFYSWGAKHQVLVLECPFCHLGSLGLCFVALRPQSIWSFIETKVVKDKTKYLPLSGSFISFNFYHKVALGPGETRAGLLHPILPVEPALQVWLSIFQRCLCPQ